MKTKIVLWGNNAQDERILIALRLRPLDSKVDIWTFPESVATEEFSNKLMDEWRKDVEVDFPEGFTHEERDLKVSEDMLPEGLTVERPDVISRAQTEWHFISLSAKLNKTYIDELSELKERIEALESFDRDIWESLKSFWSKVQEQVNEHNLFRDHAKSLRNYTNDLFSKLKTLRSSISEEFSNFSKEQFENFSQALENIEKKIEDGMNLTVLFDELKNLQRKFRDTKFTREHRSKIWTRLDAAFKVVKEKRFGKNAYNENSPMERLQRRYDGLLNAISKMEKSIQRDKSEHSFQDRKVENSDGQLEEQIRLAKIKMIEERIRSKEGKLGEMMDTKAELEKRIRIQGAKDLKRKEIEAAKEIAKEKIAAEMEAAKEALEVDKEKLEKAAEALQSKVEDTPSKKKQKKAPPARSTFPNDEIINVAISGSMVVSELFSNNDTDEEE